MSDTRGLPAVEHSLFPAVGQLPRCWRNFLTCNPHGAEVGAGGGRSVVEGELGLLTGRSASRFGQVVRLPAEPKVRAAKKVHQTPLHEFREKLLLYGHVERPAPTIPCS
jgi:hypothetical protein